MQYRLPFFCSFSYRSLSNSKYRVLVDCDVIVTADRVRLGCYGVNGGKAGKPFGVYVDVADRNEKLGGLVDKEPIKADEIFLVCTTGGGGWGNPLERSVEKVLLDVLQNKVSKMSARNDYGVVILDAEDGPSVDEDATNLLRKTLRKEQGDKVEIIDRGPGILLFEATN